MSTEDKPSKGEGSQGPEEGDGQGDVKKKQGVGYDKNRNWGNQFVEGDGPVVF